MTKQPFQNAQYLNLGTFRKNGLRVDTPVWFAAHGSVFYAFSNDKAGKIKRLKNSTRCEITPCTMTGTATGSWQETTAFLIVDSDEIATAHKALQQKYGWQMSLLDAGARLGGRIEQRIYIRLQQPL